MLLSILQQPWPWYIAGPLIGLTVPALLLAGNKSFSVSSNLRHLCAACFPAGISFFRYDWKKESWNLFFTAGMLLGGFIAATWLPSPLPSAIDPRLNSTLQAAGITNTSGMMPEQLFSFPALLTPAGFIVMIVGGFLVGFGTRYAGGCTSGHAIMGLSTLQWPSLVATMSFMAGGFLMANLLLPYILQL